MHTILIIPPNIIEYNFTSEWAKYLHQYECHYKSIIGIHNQEIMPRNQQIINNLAFSILKPNNMQRNTNPMQSTPIFHICIDGSFIPPCNHDIGNSIILARICVIKKSHAHQNPLSKTTSHLHSPSHNKNPPTWHLYAHQQPQQHIPYWVSH